MKKLAAFSLAMSLACACLATQNFERFSVTGKVSTNSAGTNIVATLPATTGFILWAQPAWLAVTFTNSNTNIVNVVTWYVISTDATVTNTIQAWTTNGPAAMDAVYLPVNPTNCLTAIGDKSFFQSSNNATNGLSNMWFTVKGVIKSEVRAWGRGEP